MGKKNIAATTSTESNGINDGCRCCESWLFIAEKQVPNFFSVLCTNQWSAVSRPLFITPLKKKTLPTQLNKRVSKEGKGEK